MSKVSKHISLSKKYNFPTSFKCINYKSSILVIAVDSARWIVLKNQSQLNFFQKLLSCNIQTALDNSDISYEDAQEVIMQIEARHLEETPIKRVSVDGDTIMHLYLTNGCNMKCPHCYMTAGKKESDELTTSEIKAIIENFSKVNSGVLTLSGGEVTLRDDFEDICLYAFNKGVSVDILTNGVLWTDELINTIGRKAHRIQISIDGYNEEENSKIRGRGNFKIALQIVHKLIEVGSNVEIAITPVFDENISKKIHNYVDFAKKLEKQYGKNIKVTFNGDLMDGRDLKLTDEHRKMYADAIQQIMVLRYGKDALDSSFIGSLRENVIRDNCAYGNLTIASNGDVYLCAFIPSLNPIGNIRKMSFDSLMELSNKAKVKSIVDNLEPCNNCELKYICGGECRIHHFPELKKDITKATNQCARRCSKEHKEMFYDLMLRLNHYFFK